MGKQLIIGKDVMIRPTIESDLPDIMELWNDGRVMKYVGYPGGLGVSLEDVKKGFIDTWNDPARHHYTITTPELGFCGELYYKVESSFRRGEIDTKLHSKAQGQGIATVAFEFLLDTVFNSEPDVDCVYVTPHDENAPAHNLYTRYGFSQIPWPDDMKAVSNYTYRELKRGDHVK